MMSQAEAERDGRSVQPAARPSLSGPVGGGPTQQQVENGEHQHGVEGVDFGDRGLRPPGRRNRQQQRGHDAANLPAAVTLRRQHPHQEMLRHQEEEAHGNAAPQHRKSVDARRRFRPPQRDLRPQPAEQAVQGIACRMDQAADGHGELQLARIAKEQSWRHGCAIKRPAARHQRQANPHLRRESPQSFFVRAHAVFNRHQPSPLMAGLLTRCAPSPRLRPGGGRRRPP